MLLLSFIVGVLVGVAAGLAALPLWQRARGSWERYSTAVIVGALLFSLALSAAVLYWNSATRSAPHAVMSQAAGAAAGGPAQSMDVEIAKLAARLARDGGPDADWELLARGYDFLGKPDEARRARAKIAGAPAALGAMNGASLSAIAQAFEGSKATASGSSPAVAPGELHTAGAEHDAQFWLARADELRTKRDFAGARKALEQVIALQAMSAASWADYADVLATLNNGSLGGDAGAAIDRALAADPTNTKALWLKASQAHDQRQFAAALQWWRRLAAVLPPGSPDARVIEGNIAEDTVLAKSSTPEPAAPATAALDGTVSVDERLASRVQPGDTLFIYAKSVDSPGPPLAVMRTSAASWPVVFRLDDSMAMIPSRRLSQFHQVIVEARISRSGQAAPASGDLFVRSAVLEPGVSPRLALVINRQIGQ